MTVIAPGTSIARGMTSWMRRVPRDAQDAIDRGEQLAQRERERRFRRRGRLRQVGAREPVAPLLAGALEHVHHLAHLLVLEQATHELRARIVPRLLAIGARQQHLRLDAQQPRRHLEVVRRLVQLAACGCAATNCSAMRAIGMS